jgi:serine/threonine-protein kinase
MRGDYPGAARAFQQSLEIEPNVNAYSNLGTLYFFQGLYPQSVTAFEKAVQLGANNHVVWANLGDAYRWTPGNQEKARKAFATALHLLGDEIRTHPDDATLQSRRALYLAKQGEARNALAAADALMTGKEKNPNNLYRLALAFELAGSRAKSLDALAQAIRNGYSKEEVNTDPELASVRRDVQFQRLMVSLQ